MTVKEAHSPHTMNAGDKLHYFTLAFITYAIPLWLKDNSHCFAHEIYPKLKWSLNNLSKGLNKKTIMVLNTFESKVGAFLHALMGCDNQYIISPHCNFNYRQMYFLKVLSAVLSEARCQPIPSVTGIVLTVCKWIMIIKSEVFRNPFYISNEYQFPKHKAY